MPMLQAGEQATSAGIAATESLLDPTAAMAYMNPYEQAVIDQSIATSPVLESNNKTKQRLVP